MCGIVGLFAPAGFPPPMDEARLAVLRDLLAHRGPDGAGLLTRGSVQFAHRRLAVIDTTEAGHQPIIAATLDRSRHSSEDSPSLVYNGEIYNDADLRRLLAARGHAFESTCDTHTLLAALCEWGTGALARLRGMFAVAFHDPRQRTILLARDPLGIKPLFWARHIAGGAATVSFASEVGPLLRLPWITRRPDFTTLNSYLTTIRTTLRSDIGERTMFEGIRALAPGEALELSLDDPLLTPRDVTPESPRRMIATRVRAAHLIDRVRDEVEASVALHLRADVPTCCLLSGGLDSTITATLARRTLRENLRTYAAGAPALRDGAEVADDLTFARDVAQSLGTHHAEAHITRELFTQRWPEMVRGIGIPLSTPNEVAIYEVAARLRRDGNVVAISGEGADELFAGYQLPMSNAANFFASRRPQSPPSMRELAIHVLADAAWIPSDSKHAVLNDDLLARNERDESLVAVYEDQLQQLASDCDDDPLQLTLRLLRRVNLAGLLARLDTAMMRASVEGRTPLADIAIAELAESLPMSLKFDGSGGTAGTKIALRRAFADVVPPAIISRPKASFPLPFDQWLEAHVSELHASPLVQECFTVAAIQTVAAQPQRLFRLAWPMINLAIWDRAVLC